MTTVDRIKYPLEVYTRYRINNNKLPEEFSNYKHNNEDYWKKKYVTCLNSTEIRGNLNSLINKRNIDEEDELLYDKIQGLLNKLSGNNFDEIGSEIRELPYVKRKHVYKLSETIILKGISEPGFSVVYAKLCKTLAPYLIIDKSEEGKDEKVYFIFALLTITQDIFEELTNTRTVGKGFDYTRSLDYSKLKLIGLMRFIGELYNMYVINESILEKCYKVVMRGIIKGEDYYESMNVYVQTFGKRLKDRNMNIYKRIEGEIMEFIFDEKEKIIKFEGNEIIFRYPKLLYKFKMMEIRDYLEVLKKE